MKHVNILFNKRFLCSFFALFFSVTISFAQEIVIKGTVSELNTANGNVIIAGKATMADEGVPGINILIEGTTSGTVTDFDGNFKINTHRDQVLKFSNIGYKTTNFAIGAHTTLQLKMEEDLQTLEEIVVIGYGVQKKKEVSGAVMQVKAEEITKLGANDVGSALQGRVAGVNIQATTGQPGASTNIQIRGISSINGANTPLFVVDGIPQDGDPRLNPHEIETIDILKDAASCAIYGTRGAAGVILITTKRGEKGKMRISYDGSVGVSSIQSSIDLMNTSEQLYFDVLFQRNNNGTHDEENNLEIEQTPGYLKNNTDLMSVVQNNGAMLQNHSLTISGGNEHFAYSVVGGYYNEDGALINSDFSRYNARVNTSYKNKKWQVDTGLGFAHENTQYTPWNILTTAMQYYPYQPTISPDSDNIGGTGSSSGFTAQTLAMNWVLQSLKMQDVQLTDKFNGNIFIGYELLKDLKISTRLGASFDNGTRSTVSPVQHIYNNEGELINDPRESFVRMMSSRGTSLVSETALNYYKGFNGHNITATAAFTLEKYTYTQFTAEKRGITDNSIFVLNGATLDPNAYSGMNPWDQDRSSTLIGSLARLMYDYKGKYLLSMSVRRDGSSKFAEENRWGFFPSASAGWNISDENFWANLKDKVNSVKLRASIGTTGNQSFYDYSYSSNLTQGIDYVYGITGGDNLALGTIQTNYSNALVKWETSVQSNIGLDVGAFDDKLTFTADVYSTEKRDMLFPLRTPPSAGAGSDGNADVILNMGNMINKGVELSLGYRTMDKALNWGINGTFTKNINEITKINGSDALVLMGDGTIIDADQNSKVTGLKEGYEAGAYFLIPTNGVVQNEAELAEYKKVQPDARMGDLIYQDTNADGLISDDDRVYMGSAMPDFELGAIVDLSYKNFDFSMQWYGSFGGEVMNGSKAAAYSYGRHADLVNVWSEANPTSNIPTYRGSSKEHDNYAGYSDLWLEDGSYVRLRNVMLGYTLGENGRHKLGVQKLRFYVSGQNLLTFTDYTGYDPEVGGNGLSTRGLDRGNYPVSASYRVGVQIDF